MTTLGILHPGSMGAAIAAQATAVATVLWCPQGRSDATVVRAGEHALTPVGTLPELANRADIILSICPPGNAEEVATAVAECSFSGVYVDANAISPQTANAVADKIGAGYVDGGIIGPPPVRAGTTRLYLSGARAGEVAAVFDGTPLEARAIEGDMTASALKMAYAAWTKGSAALLLAIEATAASLGVAPLLHEEWELSQPDAPARLAAARAAADAKGWRWVSEMREIAATFAAAGQPDGFHRAAAEVYEAGG